MRLGLALLVVFLAAASPAAADSILFVRAGDVWISTPDGGTERPLTSGGGFTSPSMADDGTIVALRGRMFVRLRPDGAAVFGVSQPPPVLPALRCVIPGGPFASPTWSPDGTMLAWEPADGVHVAGPVPDLRRARLFHGATRAGRLLRRRARAGTLRLRVPLNRAARRALARSGRLTLRLRLEVRAPGRATAKARRRVVVSQI